MFCSAQASHLVSHRHPKLTTMSNRSQVLSMIHVVMTRIKNAPNREQRFNLLENAQILADILQEVTQFEQSLITDLDVD
jgi:cAMP phosphodiesterase